MEVLKMIKFIRKKILCGIVKDIIKDMPEYKEYALLFFEEHKKEIIGKIKDSIVSIIKGYLAEHIK